mgnify:FL=1
MIASSKICAIAMVAFSAACFAAEEITIEDYIVGAPYEILQVDGNAPERAQHGQIVTVVPLVKIDAGEHVLTLRLNDIKLNEFDDTEIILKVELLPGNHYR